MYNSDNNMYVKKAILLQRGLEKCNFAAEKVVI